MVALNDTPPPSDEHLLTLIRVDDQAAFAALYHRYAQLLFGYAMKRINDTEASEEIIQEVFIRLWERRNNLEHVTEVKPYLYAAVRHRTVNHIAHSVVRVQYARHYEAFAARHDNSTEETVALMDLNETLERSLNTLPENCQKVFRMSRMEHLTIPEIAERMQLNPRTIENYITQALQHLRKVWKR